MTAQTLYNKLNSGEITKEKFLYEIRKQNLPSITKFNSFNDTVKILKNKSIISEVKEKSPELPEIDAPTIDMVSPYEYSKGINFELKLDGVSIIHNTPTEAEMVKAQKKVLNNLGKDKYYYSRKLMSDEEKKLEKNNEREYELTDKNTIHNKKKGIMREMKHPQHKGKNSYFGRDGVTLSKDEKEDHKKEMSDFQKRLKKVSNRIENEKQVAEGMYEKQDDTTEDTFSLEYLMNTINESEDPYTVKYSEENDTYQIWKDGEIVDDKSEESNADKEAARLNSLAQIAKIDAMQEGYDEDEEDLEELEIAKAEARRISKEEGVAQHVNKLRGGGYSIEDWYDSDATVASYESGRSLNESDDPRDELANSEFGMDYDQLGVGEKEWCDDELEMREGTDNDVNMESPEWRSIIEDIIGEWGLVSFDMTDDEVMDEVEAEVKRRASLNEYGDDKGSIETDDENQAKKLADQGKNVILKDKQ